MKRSSMKLEKKEGGFGRPFLYRATVAVGAEWPRTRLVLEVADYALCASGSQMLILRVSGIRNRLSTKHIAGTAIGYIRA
jgi:hypothetical protein